MKKKSRQIFIEGINNIPKKLDKDELYYYLERSHEEVEARDYVIIHSIRLVINRVNTKYNYLPYEKDDLISIGLIGLINAVDTFDISKHYEFSTYATNCIDNAILGYIAKNRKYTSEKDIYKRDSSNSKRKYIMEECFYDLGSMTDYASDLDEKYENECVYEEIRKIVNAIPSSRDKKIVMLYFGFINDRVYSQKEIADIIHISRYYVSVLLDSTVRKIALKLKGRGMIEKFKEEDIIIKKRKLVSK